MARLVKKIYNINEIEMIAKQLLKNIGFKVHHSGYKYWIKAITISMDIKSNNRQTTNMQQLYYLVAREYGLQASNIERAMRYSYKSEDMQDYFKISYKVTNTVLLSLFLEEIERAINVTFDYEHTNPEIALYSQTDEPKILDCVEKG